MTTGTFTEEINYVVRDIDTGEIKEDFRTLGGAKSYLSGMNFKLGYFYEVYGIREKKVVFILKQYDVQTNTKEGKTQTWKNK